MKHFTIITALLFISFISFSQSADSLVKAGSEPLATFEITINGKKYNIAENEELKLDTVFSKPSISIKLAAYKKFESSGISFDYPKHLAFEFEQDFGYKGWTLSGSSLVVMVFEMDAMSTLNMMLDEMIKKFGKKNCTVEDYRKELGGKMWNCKKLTVKIAGQRIVMECYDIKLDDFKSRFIYFQNSTQGDINSAEYEDGFNIINSTIRFK